MSERGRTPAAPQPRASSPRTRSRIRRFGWLLPHLFVVSLCAPSWTHAAVELTQVRAGVTPERTRLVFEFSQPRYTYRHSLFGDTLLVLRLPGVKRAASCHVPEVSEGLARFVRVGADRQGGLEIRVSLAAPARVKLFRLERKGSLPTRLVVDLTARKATTKNALAKPPAAPVPPVTSVVPPASAPRDVIIEHPSVESAAGGSADTAAPPEPGVILEPSGSSKPMLSDTPTRSGHGAPHVIVIDPGHGGHDPGAVGQGLREKDVCLDVAKRMAAALNKKPGLRAVVTRQDDRFVSLGERMRRAEREGADVFISIHVNAAPTTRASGAEVFFLSIGAATDRAAAELARLENEADPDFVVEEDEALKGLPFVVDLRQSDTMMRSSRLAEVVLDILTSRGLAEPRGVKQAGFAVLKSFQVTSILVEVGFISSPSERKKLKSADHRRKLAEALAEGVERYFAKFAPAAAPPR
jgi:N-acetylmuramoyl-L-alanine amidase